MEFDVIATVLAYCTGAGVLSAAIGRISPSIAGFKRHALAGGLPFAAVLGGQILTNETVVLISGTLAFGVSLVIGGIGTSMLVEERLQIAKPKVIQD